MHKKDWLQEIEAELPPSKYKDRFLEELEDHFDEIESREHLKPKQKQTDAQKKLGPPQLATSFFTTLMKNKTSFQTFADAFVIGLISIPLVLPLFFANALVDHYDTNLFVKGILFLISTLGVSVTFGLWFFLLKNKINALSLILSKKEKILFYLLLFLPIILVTGNYAVYYGYMQGTDHGQDLFFPLAMLLLLGAGIFGAIYSLKHSVGKETNHARILIGLCIAGSLIATRGTIIEVLHDSLQLFSAVLGIKLSTVLGIVFLLIGLYELWAFVKAQNKKHPASLLRISTSILLFGFTFITLPIEDQNASPFSEKDLHWSVAAIHLNPLMEAKSNQKNLFKNLDKNLTRLDEWFTDGKYGDRYTYPLEMNGEWFLHSQIGGDLEEVFLVEKSSTPIQEIKDADTKEALENDSSSYKTGEILLPKEFTCIPNEFLATHLLETYGENYKEVQLTMNGETDCQALEYQGATLYKFTGNQENARLSELVLSTDPTWALIGLGNQFYLVKLQGSI